MATCTLTTIQSWFTCIQGGMPFTEVVCAVIFFVFFLFFGEYPLRERVIAAGFISAMAALVFLGMGAINPAVPIILVIIVAAAWVFLNSQNS